MTCKKCNGKGIEKYYHDAGDHFGGGTAPGSEWRWSKCTCLGDRELRCKYMSNTPGHPIFNEPSCKSTDRPGNSCGYHSKYYGDCEWFEIESEKDAKRRDLKERLITTRKWLEKSHRQEKQLEKELSML